FKPPSGEQRLHNCSSYLSRLVKEIVGIEAYRAAEIRLRKGGEEKLRDFLGTFERMFTDKLAKLRKMNEVAAESILNF
ncbi:MAG: hypothetical protein ACK559_38680, partial [bacterium]